MVFNFQIGHLVPLQPHVKRPQLLLQITTARSIQLRETHTLKKIQILVFRNADQAKAEIKATAGPLSPSQGGFFPGVTSSK